MTTLIFLISKHMDGDDKSTSGSESYPQLLLDSGSSAGSRGQGEP